MPRTTTIPARRRSAGSCTARGLLAWSPRSHTEGPERMRALEMPIVWLAGERDEKYVALLKRIAELRLPGERYVIAGAGHRVHRDAPDAVAAALA